MANCAKCGAPIAEDSAFCGSCGQPRAQAGPAMPASGSVAAAPAMVVGTVSSGTATGTASAPGLTMNMAAALSYALGAITGILFLVLEPYKNNRFVRFHAIQSIILNVAIVALAIIVGILVSIGGFWVLTVALPLDWLFGLGIFALWLFLMFQAYSEREFRIPWIGDIAAKQVK